MAKTDNATTEKAEIKAPVSNKQTTKQKNSSPLKIVLIVVGAVFGVLALILVFIIVIALFATSGPTKVSDSFINNIQTKNSSAGYAELSSGAQTTVPQEQFKQVVDQIGPILSGKPSDKKTESQTVNGKKTAKVSYTIKGSDGNTYKITVDLVEQDDTWKVEVFNSEKQ